MSYEATLPYNDLPDLPAPGFAESTEILKHLAVASRHLGELKGLCASLPDPTLLINTIILQESKDSSAIENIVTTQDELYKAASEENEASKAAKEVLSYREALYAGLTNMKARQNLLLTNTMVEIVQTIRQNNAGIRNAPGTALKNAITGEVVYTPPCCEDIIRNKLSSLERFINEHDLSRLDPLIKMAFIHYQFESIHPFADGNGRTGRILNALYLVQQGLLNQPVLYLSSYILAYKVEYYRLLREVTEKNNWNDWVMYILTAVIKTTQLTTENIKQLLALKQQTEEEMRELMGSKFNHDLLELLFKLPYLKISILVRNDIFQRQAASAWLNRMVVTGIVTMRKIGRDNYFINQRLLDIFTAPHAF